MTEATASAAGAATPTPAPAAPGPVPPVAPPGTTLPRRLTAEAGRRLRAVWAGELDLGRIGMAISVPVLCWVFYTTSSGMIDIMQKEAGDWVGLIGTLVATTAVLVMLTSTSWSLGSDLASLITRRRMARERMVIKTLITAVVFLFVFSISAFFSFTYYYNNIFRLSSKKIAAELQPMELAADVVLPAMKDIVLRSEEASARIVATPSYRAYLAALDALIETAQSAGASLRDSIQKNQEAQRQIALQAAQKAAAELAEAQAAARQIEELQNRIALLERSAADIDAIVKSKQDEITALTTTARQEEQLSVDASKGLDGLGAACGHNCLTHKAKAQDVLKRAATIRETLAAPLAERANALKQRDALNAQILTLKHKAENATALAERPTPRAEAAPDLAALLRDLSAERDQLRVDPSWSRVRQAKPLCEPILAAARAAHALPAAVPADFACEPAGAEARDLLSARDEALAGRAAFEQKCSLDGTLRDEVAAITARIHASSDPAAGPAGFAEAKKLVDACVVSAKAAGLSETDVRELLKRSDAFLRAHTTERNKFELAREAFWSFTPDSTMAICVAMAQDAFVFIMKFLSEIFKRGFEARERRQFSQPLDLTDNETDPVETRAMKALMRAARPVHGDMSEIDPEAATIVGLPLNVRENLSAILNRLVRDEIAHVDRRGFYLVDNVTVAQIEARLASALRPHWSARLRAVGADGRESAADGPKAYYGDPSGEAKRRRPSALERYLAPDPAGDAQG